MRNNPFLDSINNANKMRETEKERKEDMRSMSMAARMSPNEFLMISEVCQQFEARQTRYEDYFREKNGNDNYHATMTA